MGKRRKKIGYRLNIQLNALSCAHCILCVGGSSLVFGSPARVLSTLQGVGCCQGGGCLVFFFLPLLAFWPYLHILRILCCTFLQASIIYSPIYLLKKIVLFPFLRFSMSHIYVPNLNWRLFQIEIYGIIDSFMYHIELMRYLMQDNPCYLIKQVCQGFNFLEFKKSEE